MYQFRHIRLQTSLAGLQTRQGQDHDRFADRVVVLPVQARTSASVSDGTTAHAGQAVFTESLRYKITFVLGVIGRILVAIVFGVSLAYIFFIEDPSWLGIIDTILGGLGGVLWVRERVIRFRHPKLILSDKGITLIHFLESATETNG